jgi:integrase
MAAMGRLLAGAPEPSGARCRDIFNLFLEDCDRRVQSKDMAASTLANYAFVLERADRSFGTRPMDAVRHRDLVAWFGQLGWNNTSRAGALSILKACVRWAKRERLCVDSDILSYRGPAPSRRRPRMPPDLVPRLLEHASNDQIRDLILALAETGCRPSEVARVTAADWSPDEGTWTLVTHKTANRTGEDRVVYLSPAMQELTRRLAGAHPEGPLFLNAHNEPWNARAWGRHFARLSEHLGVKVTAYGLRHRFVTVALARGVSLPVVSKLAGHASLRTTSTYTHLDQMPEVLRGGLGQALRPSLPDTDPGTPQTASSPAVASSRSTPRGRRRRS